MFCVVFLFDVFFRELLLLHLVLVVHDLHLGHVREALPVHQRREAPGGLQHPLGLRQRLADLVDPLGGGLEVVRALRAVVAQEAAGAEALAAYLLVHYYYYYYYYYYYCYHY